MKSPGKERGGIGRWWSPDMGPFLTLGLQLAISVIVFLFLGRWLDTKFETSPWLTLGGAALGITGGLIKFFLTALKLGEDADRTMKERGKNGAGKN